MIIMFFESPLMLFLRAYLYVHYFIFLSMTHAYAHIL